MIGALALVLTGCTAGSPATSPATSTPAPTHTTPTPTAPSTADTASTTGSTPTEPGPDCDGLPDAPLSVETFAVTTTEDFDFDADGWLVYAENGGLVGVDIDGHQRLVALGVGAYLRGIQVLASEDLVVADFNVGRLLEVDHLTGGLTTITASLSAPNGLEVGDGDVVYVSDASPSPSVRALDPAGGAPVTIPLGQLSTPNGLALDPSQSTLYIAADRQGVYASTRAVDGGWNPAAPAFDPGGAFDAVEVDACGNVYTVEFYSGRLYRYDPVDDTVTLLVDLDDPAEWLWNAIRWGSDRGGWRRDVLYVTNRHQVYGVALGVPGRAQPIDGAR